MYCWYSQKKLDREITLANEYIFATIYEILKSYFFTRIDIFAIQNDKKNDNLVNKKVKENLNTIWGQCSRNTIHFFYFYFLFFLICVVGVLLFFSLCCSVLQLNFRFFTKQNFSHKKQDERTGQIVERKLRNEFKHRKRKLHLQKSQHIHIKSETPKPNRFLKIQKYPTIEAYCYTVWKLGHFNPHLINKEISEVIQTRELGEITVWYDTMSNLSFMSPDIFESLKKWQKNSKTNICVRTGNEETFIVNKYIPIHCYNPSGEEILVHFYQAPGLTNNPKVKFLLSANATYKMGLRLAQQPDIIIRNTMSPYEAISDKEFENYDLFKNLQHSEYLYTGKNRDEIDYEFINLQVVHIKDLKVKQIVLDLLYQNPLVIATRNKLNISYIPKIFFDVRFKKNAIWPKPRPIPLSRAHRELVDTEVENYVAAGFLEIATDPSPYAAGIFCIDKKKPKNAPKDWKPESRLCVDFSIFNSNCEEVVEQIPKYI